MKSRRRSLARPAPPPAEPPSPAPTPPSTPTAKPVPNVFNAFLREQTAMNTLKATGIEQGWSPPTLRMHGDVIAHLPKGPERLLKSHEIIELVRVYKEWGRTITVVETVQLLGWPQP